MSKIKIAQILHSVGGVDVYIRLLLDNIDNQKFSNIIIHSLDDTKNDFSKTFEGSIKDYKVPIFREINPLKDLSSLFRTIRILRKESPSVIHAHSAKAGFIGKLAGIFTGIPVLYTPHAYSYLSAESKFKSKLYFFLEYILKNSNNKVLACSKSEQQRAINEVGYKLEKTILYNNCINPVIKTSPLTIKKTWPDNYICSVGRPSYQKNIEFMLDVIAEAKKTIPDTHLVLMGVGYHAPNLENVKRKIDLLELKENVTLLEWTERENIFTIIEKSRVYITTSRYEGLPYSVIESLALGKPIVATDVDGNRDLVKDGYNGFLIDETNKRKMSEVIIELLTNKDLNDKFSSNSKKMFKENFDITINIKKLEKIYLEHQT